MKLDGFSPKDMEQISPALKEWLKRSQALKQLVDGIKELTSTLQKILEREQNNHSQDASTCKSSDEKDCTLHQEQAKGTRPSDTMNPGEKYTKPNIDPSLVQIQAGKSEIERRINAFIERKQEEVDGLNRREFCCIIEDDKVESCARTDAIFTPRNDSKSHVKVTRVINRFGPQTRLGPNVSPKTNIPQASILPRVDIKQEPGTSIGSSDHLASTCNIPFGVEERLRNMETHLKVSQDAASQSNVYGRLKNLEERILHLESLSPEYFDYLPPGVKKRKIFRESDNSNWTQPKSEDQSINDIDANIQQLKQALQNRQRKNSSGSYSMDGQTTAAIQIKQEAL